jgi:hypothetical protein
MRKCNFFRQISFERNNTKEECRRSTAERKSTGNRSERTTRQRRNSKEKVKEKDNTDNNVGQCKDCRTKKKKVEVGTNEGI